MSSAEEFQSSQLIKRIRKPTSKEFFVASSSVSVIQPARKKAKTNNIQASKDKEINKNSFTVIARSNLQRAHLEQLQNYVIDCAPSVTLSYRDKATQLKLSDDKMSCFGVEVNK